MFGGSGEDVIGGWGKLRNEELDDYTDRLSVTNNKLIRKTRMRLVEL